MNGNAITPKAVSNSYTDVLPNLQVRFEPREDLVFRAAYSRTLGRPTFGQLKISGTLSATPLNDGTFDGELSEGNIDLKPYVSDNLDATAEWYFAQGGLPTPLRRPLPDLLGHGQLRRRGLVPGVVVGGGPEDDLVRRLRKVPGLDQFDRPPQERPVLDAGGEHAQLQPVRDGRVGRLVRRLQPVQDLAVAVGKAARFLSAAWISMHRYLSAPGERMGDVHVLGLAHISFYKKVAAYILNSLGRKALALLVLPPPVERVRRGDQPCRQRDACHGRADVAVNRGAREFAG